MVIKCLKSIKDEMETEDRFFKIGCMVCSSLSIIKEIVNFVRSEPNTEGRDAPSRTDNTIVRLVTGAITYIAGNLKTKRVNQKLNRILRMLKEHKKTSLEMAKNLQPLELEIQSIEEKIKQFEQSQTNSADLKEVRQTLNQIMTQIQRKNKIDLVTFSSSSIDGECALRKFLVSLQALRSGFETPPKESMLEDVEKFTDLYSLTMNATDLLDKGRLCKEARLLDDIIKEMEDEYEQLDENFNAYLKFIDNNS